MTDGQVRAALAALPAAPSVLVEGRTQQQVQALYRYAFTGVTFMTRQIAPGRVLVWRVR